MATQPKTTSKAAAKPKAAEPKAAAPKKAAAAAKPKAAAKPRTVNAALSKPLKVSEQLAEVVGTKHDLPRTEVVSKVWEYIRKHNLQNPENKREILADAKLKAVFGHDKVTMFEMNKYLSAHLSQ